LLARQQLTPRALGCEEGAIVNRRFNETGLLSLFLFWLFIAFRFGFFLRFYAFYRFFGLAF
jgi:hypothetical protein